MSEGLIKLKHVLVTQTINHDAQLAASVICNDSKRTRTYTLTQSDRITFECIHGTSEFEVRVASDQTMFEIGDDHFTPRGNECL